VKVDFERFFSFVHPDDKDLRSRELKEQLTDVSYKDYYFRIITADNQEKILHGQSEVLTDENGDPYKIIGTCQDVTEQKILEKALTEKTVQLEKSNASLQVFAYISSHDLKEPLRKISLLGDRLRILNRGKIDEQSSGLLNKMISSSLRLQQMIDEILSISRINSDERFEDIDLQKLLDEALRVTEHHAEEYLAVIKSDGLPVACVNRTQFHQLFTNLISNSLKFRKQGIAPEISINHDYLSTDEAEATGLNPSKKWLRIRFTDNGIGFDNEYNEKVFALFQRLHSRNFEGTGIGLAICKEIVNHHLGHIHAHGLVGVGATFTIIIPVTRDE
jgi:light-regulated signal transduction histidine kinase (bacteriophytochrome)